MDAANSTDLSDDLDAVLADIWQRLGRAAKDRRAAMHTPVIATITADGIPTQRVMVLRAFDRATATLRFHTDARAAKVDQVGYTGAVSVLAYDPGAKRQFRLTGVARIETATPAADAAWAEATLFAKRCYLADPAPGTVSQSPVSGLPADIEGRKPDDEDEVAAGRDNFALLMVQIDTIEFLHLAHTGHRRARFHQTESQIWQGAWLVP
ncbi:pyridoxamine 5'-phosphate oxidase family protein [Blastomonas sp.]|uniref:pyridoxamine 5'-phosphate oxidase family protein n=1 Tax=Blastomonas sp. TaxID=1909299 RepID=UPI002619C39E|nr:pyridoxamine 5'-phosphate oxidase family protein [Blastomonas sp.]MDM7957203.1 pyridoxamine 5'-phosphate oxidase family protein [Blastomonas sp.]